MKVSIKAVRERTESLAEACICYTGELQDDDQKKYTLQYYLDMARQLEDEGAHLLAIIRHGRTIEAIQCAVISV